MPQEFLASFAVDIDEAGVNRLQTILSQNRDLANDLAAAFVAARTSMLDFIHSATEELSALPFFSRPASVEEAFGASGTFSIDLDFSRASKQLETFLTAAKKQMKLTADGSGIISAASVALSQVRSMFSSANLTLKVKVETEGETDRSDGFSGSSVSFGKSGAFSPAPVMMLSTGGRFSSPTHAEIAEDGDPEYVIPVKKEPEAVPLVRSLLSELSASARESLRDALPVDDPSAGSLFASAPEVSRYESLMASAPTIPDASPLSGLADVLSVLPEMLSAAPAAATPAVVTSAPQNNVQAPVNIHVEAAAADPEAVGRSIYDTAERYLLRTLQGVS